MTMIADCDLFIYIIIIIFYMHTETFVHVYMCMYLSSGIDFIEKCLLLIYNLSFVSIITRFNVRQCRF